MPKKIIDVIKITPVEYADEVLKIALVKELKWELLINLERMQDQFQEP